jgi:hypothetical protein
MEERLSISVRVLIGVVNPRRKTDILEVKRFESHDGEEDG